MTKDAWISLLVKVLLMVLTPLAAQLHINDGATLTALATDIADVIVLLFGMYQVWNTKRVNVDAKVIAPLLIAFVLLGALVPSARAADNLTVKAVPAASAPAAWLNGYPYGSSGPIFGLFTEAGGGPVNASIPGVNSASLTTTTAGIGVVGGYAWGSKTSMIAYSIEGKASATNVNGANQGFSVAGPVSFEGTGYVWMPVSVIQNALSILSIPNPFSTIAPFPPNQANITASNLQAGFGGGFRADDVTVAYFGAGSNKAFDFSPKIEFDLMEQLSNGSAVREYVETVFQKNGAIFGAQQSKAVLGTKYMAGVMVLF